MSNGKGSKPRPLSIPRAELRSRLEAIFGKVKIGTKIIIKPPTKAQVSAKKK